jgi:D-alanyl-D-alanine carboxypeptidase
MTILLVAFLLNLQSHDSAIQARLEELHKTASFPGMTAAYLDKAGKVHEFAVGLSDKEANRPMAVGDRMLAGSTGKTFVAAVAMQLFAEGKLGLDDRLEQYLGKASWFNRLPNHADITLRQLMNHSSGVPEHVLAPDLIKALHETPDKQWKPEELVAFILDKPAAFKAGEGFSYADTNYVLLGMAMEAATGKTVVEMVEKRILKPQKLGATNWAIGRQLPKLATGYSMPNSPFGYSGEMVKDGKFLFDPQMEWTGGGFLSTPGDLARWAKILFTTDLVPKKELMLQGIPANTGPQDQYGLGVQIRNSPYGISHGHGGWFPGYLTEIEYFPEHGIAVAVQFNTDAGRTLGRSPRAWVGEIMKILISG